MSLPEKGKRPRCRALDSGYSRQSKSRKQEDRIAKRIGGKRQPASGALPDYGFKGDVRETDFLIEAKRSDAQSINVRASWLMKIEVEADRLGKFPALCLEIGKMFPGMEKDWCLIPVSVFKRLLERK